MASTSHFTRNMSNCVIFGAPQEMIENMPPTYNCVMKQFLYSNNILKEERQNKKLPFLEVAKEVTNKILAIWCKASLPTVSEKRVTKMLADYDHKYLSILKSFNSRKEQITFKQKVKNFDSSSKVRLFDICSCKCTDFNQCSRKRELKVPTNEQMFLTDQRASRQMFIGGSDEESM